VENQAALSTEVREASTGVDSKLRNANIDALRGVAILLVLLHHLGIPGFITGGWIGVDLFFVLSGFLISGLLFAEWKDRGAIDIRRFYLRRAFKIYPAFYTMIGATILVDRFIVPGLPSFPVRAAGVFAEAAFFQNYARGIWGHTWSLAIEEHFYLVLPLLLWWLYKRNPERPFRALPTLFLWIESAELGLRLFYGWTLNTVSSEPSYAFPTHLRFDSLFFGVLLGYLYHFEGAQFREYAQSKAGLLICVLAILCAGAVGLPNPVMHTFGYTLVMFGFGFLLCRAASAPPRRLFFPLQMLGVYSYSIYLWHGWACRLLPRTNLREYSIAFVAAVAPGILFAYVVEFPALRLRGLLFPVSPAGGRLSVPRR
jgi:peptidoglycan/LPS O-acetylase OafA/YrhL